MIERDGVIWESEQARLGAVYAARTLAALILAGVLLAVLQ